MRRISPPDVSWSYPSLMSVQIANANFFELYYDFQEKQKLEMPGLKEIDDKIFKYQLKIYRDMLLLLFKRKNVLQTQAHARNRLTHFKKFFFFQKA